jgi:signal transduction histidine kinase
MTAGMGVELPKVLRVLAHELRGSLGVIQGYVRLLKERHTAEETDVRMLNAMLAATARITEIARHASDVATWQDGRMGEPHATIKVRDLIDRAISGSGGGPCQWQRTRPASSSRRQTPALSRPRSRR